ncbi:MAG: putative molybdenum carrier protein [bacterium]
MTNEDVTLHAQPNLYRTRVRRLLEKGGNKTFSRIEKIVSGGQTGVDRAALDVALELGIPCGGWCPKGRRAEDGPIDIRYPLKETHSTNYRIRTEKNVRDSDGTLIFTWGKPKGGTALTIRFAQKYKRPYLMVDLSERGDPETVRKWVEANQIKVLNIAGLRESESPGIYERTVDFLKEVFNKPKR